MPQPKRRDLFQWLKPPTKTPEGFWIGEGIVARSGTMLYAEEGPDGERIEWIEYVPESVIRDFLPGLAHKPIVIRHPEGDEDVTPSNYRFLTVGHTGSIRFMYDPEDPETLLAIAELHVQESQGINALESGKFSELSPGYTAQTEPTPGMTPQGLAYDLKQVSRVHNHLALVEDARGGDRMQIRRDSATMQVTRRDNAGTNNQQSAQQRVDAGLPVNQNNTQQAPRQDSSNDVLSAIAALLAKHGYGATNQADNAPQFARNDMQPMQQPARQDVAPAQQNVQPAHQDAMPRLDSEEKARRDAAAVTERVELIAEGQRHGLQLTPDMSANAMRRQIVSARRSHTRRDATDADIMATYRLLKEDDAAQEKPPTSSTPPAPGGWGAKPPIQLRRDNADEEAWVPFAG